MGQTSRRAQTLMIHGGALVLHGSTRFECRVSKQTEGLAVNTSERKERRGFASMSAEKQREIASKGGRAAHEKGTAHEWTADEARNAGRKGGQVSRGGRGRLVVPSDATPAPETADDDGATNRAE